MRLARGAQGKLRRKRLVAASPILAPGLPERILEELETNFLRSIKELRAALQLQHQHQLAEAAQLLGKIATAMSALVEAAAPMPSDRAVQIRGGEAHYQELRNVAHQLDETAHIIRDVSEDARMLALNATIEARRAGEADQRLGVIAGDARAFAERIATAVERIDEFINALAGVPAAAENGTPAAPESGQTPEIRAAASALCEIAGQIAERICLSRSMEMPIADLYRVKLECLLAEIALAVPLLEGALEEAKRLLTLRKQMHRRGEAKVSAHDKVLANARDRIDAAIEAFHSALRGADLAQARQAYECASAASRAALRAIDPMLMDVAAIPAAGASREAD